MRLLFASLCLLLTTGAIAQDTAKTQQFAPRNYMLVSAVGAEFTVVVQKETVGSHLPAYRKIKLGSAGEAVNRMVLADLDSQVAAKEPNSQRALMIHPGALDDSIAPYHRAQANLDAVLAELKPHPHRSTWDRIMVVTPAFHGGQRSKMASGLYGIGMYIQPLCASNLEACANNTTPSDGPTAQLPDGTVKRVNTFFTPYFFITVWELDAATLEVINKKEVFENKRMASSDGNFAFDPSDSPAIAKQVVNLVETSIKSALKQVGPSGKVEIRVVKDPEPAK